MKAGFSCRLLNDGREGGCALGGLGLLTCLWFFAFGAFRAGSRAAITFLLTFQNISVGLLIFLNLITDNSQPLRVSYFSITLLFIFSLETFYLLS